MIQKKPAPLKGRAPAFSIAVTIYSRLRYRSAISSTLVSRGLPGQQASAKADSDRNWTSSSFKMPLRLAGIPTSSDSCLTAAMMKVSLMRVRSGSTSAQMVRPEEILPLRSAEDGMLSILTALCWICGYIRMLPAAT